MKNWSGHWHFPDWQQVCTTSLQSNNLDVLDVLTPIVRCSSLVHADNVRAYLRAAFELGIHAKNISRWRGQIPEFGSEHNPVAATRRAVKRKPVGTRVLDWSEVMAVNLPCDRSLRSF